MKRHTDEKTARYMRMLDDHMGVISKVCYMYAEDAEHFKDLRQEVTANIWTGMDSFRGDSAESTWVYRVALNTCVTYFRRNKRHAGALSLDCISDVASDESDSERTARLKEMYALIGRLGKLDKAIVMLWLDEYSYDDIASFTGLSRTNVGSRLHRIRQHLINESNR
ncbi:MAG: sigma-70 family RNA polymerase sigma factor [Muribaculaceae bacterium]|nr:sigma-70 family RNA polymerase sigma factor [Muribaculaceae bacterium]